MICLKLMPARVLGVVVALAFLAGCEKGPPLPTGRWIEPPSGNSTPNIGGMPVNMAISPDGKYVVTTAAGYKEELCVMRIADGRIVSELDYANSYSQQGVPAATNPTTRLSRSNGLYYGITFGPDDRLYVAQGANKTVAALVLDAEGKLNQVKQFRMKPSDFPAGLAADQRGYLYVTQNDPSTQGRYFGTPASVVALESRDGLEAGRYTFADDLGLSNFPLAVTVKTDGSRLYVASERDSAVYVLDASNPAKITLLEKVVTGDNPTAVLLNKDGSRLFVANGNSDTISVVDTASDKVVATVLVRPEVARDLAGATPTGLALSGNEKWLYATLGDMNAVAVIDLKDKNGTELEGYIPTGWYPTSIKVAGNQLLVTNQKGDRARVIHDYLDGHRMITPLSVFEGSLWRIAAPDKDALADLTKKCLEDARLTTDRLNAGNPLQGISLQSGSVRHVFYIIKENRSYDNVLGDMTIGNGDPNRCLFGRDVTPNQHALAERFGLLDNFYDCAEVSGDGWSWSTEAEANEFAIRNVPYYYARSGRQYDFEGSNNRYPTGGLPEVGPDGKPLSDEVKLNGAKPIPDVAEPAGGHIWDMARRRGLTYRNYGCFMTIGVTANGKTIIPDNYPASAGVQPGGHDLAGITDVDYRKFDLNFPDSDAPHELGFTWSTRQFGQAKLPSRVAEWKREFGLMLQKDPNGGAVPEFETIRLGTDHTNAARGGSPTPRCMVADNDYAVGELVDAVSHSPIWKNSVIVILEDDAQNGPDHVDAHRSSCLIVSPFMSRGHVNHSFQNTISAIKTMECLLNLPPMCQYDAAADAIGGWEDGPENAEPFAVIQPAAAIFKERNPAGGRDQFGPTDPSAQKGGDSPLQTPEELAAVSAEMDLSRADQVQADLLNRVIWKTVRGVDSEMPPTPHSISAGGAVSRDEEDD